MKQAGQIALLTTIVLSIVMIYTVFLISGSLTFFQNSKYSLEGIQATNLAEAGIDKAVASLNTSGGSYSGESETLLGPGSFSVAVTSLNPSTSKVESTGYIPNKLSPKVRKKISIQISKGIGTSFNYGLQIGEGGIQMGNGAIINGSAYSNGNIAGGNTTSVTGDVYVAGGTQPTANQQADCVSPNCLDFIFGKNTEGGNKLDVAQSFQPSSTAVINKVSLKLKKIGSPPNVTVRILSDNNGKPSKTVLASGTLFANLVTTQYGFADVAFTTTPTLNTSTTYWITIDTSSDSNNYWSWQGDSLQGYTPGAAKWSPNWNASTPVWNNPSPQLDLAFKTFMGGVATFINLGNGSTINGNVHANTITGGNGITINGNAYYQTIGSSVTVNGSSFPGSSDPAPTVFPVSDANITDWKNQAESAGVTTGDIIGCSMSLGPGKIVGNLTLGNGCNVTVKSPLWITGNISAGNTTKFKLDQSEGASSGLIIVDGTVSIGNGCDFIGSGTTGSYLMVLSTYDSRTSGVEAIDTGNSAISGIFYAPFGIIDLANGASFKEVTAWKLTMGNSSVLNYETGLANVFFSSGPSGSFSVIKGTYQSK